MFDHSCQQCGTQIEGLEANIVNDVKCVKCGLEFQIIPYKKKSKPDLMALETEYWKKFEDMFNAEHVLVNPQAIWAWFNAKFNEKNEEMIQEGLKRIKLEEELYFLKVKLDKKDLEIGLRNDAIDALEGCKDWQILIKNLLKKITKLQKETETIQSQRVMEQGGWQQVEAYQEEIATIKAQLSRFEKGEAAPIIMVKQKEEIIKLRVEIERLKGQEEK